ncbi:MAG: hypothetical protein HY514_02495 [Candidatus Aenigmarchaeota archaeon]|nr:hypothetical protein [Candidatus Aenigmarchaeota archaeon]
MGDEAAREFTARKKIQMMKRNISAYYGLKASGELRGYHGKIIVLENGRLIASGDDIRAAERYLQENPVAHIFATRVRTDQELVCYAFS